MDCKVTDWLSCRAACVSSLQCCCSQVSTSDVFILQLSDPEPAYRLPWHNLCLTSDFAVLLLFHVLNLLWVCGYFLILFFNVVYDGLT